MVASNNRSLFLAYATCPLAIGWKGGGNGGSVRHLSESLKDAGSEQPLSLVLLPSKPEGRKGLVGLVLALKCFSLQVTPFTAFLNLLTRTSHCTPLQCPRRPRTIIPSCIQQEES